MSGHVWPANNVRENSFPSAIVVAGSFEIGFELALFLRPPKAIKIT
jgi:hypothetical protein